MWKKRQKAPHTFFLWELDVGNKSLGQTGVNQIAAFRQNVGQRFRKDGEQPVLKIIADEEAKPQGNQRVGQSFAQFNQMFSQRHFKIFVGFHNVPFCWVLEL